MRLHASPNFLITFVLSCLLTACGGGSDSPSGSSTGAARAQSLQASAVSAPTIIVSMPESFTPSKNVGLVFLQGGHEQKVRFVDGEQVVELKNELFQILVPDGEFFDVLISTDEDSTYVAGDPIYIGGNVMGRSASDSPAGWGLAVGTRYNFNAWARYELPSRGAYKVINIREIHDRYLSGVKTSKTSLDLLIFISRPYGSTQKPVPSDYEMIKLKIKP